MHSATENDEFNKFLDQVEPGKKRLIVVVDAEFLDAFDPVLYNEGEYIAFVLDGNRALIYKHGCIKPYNWLYLDVTPRAKPRNKARHKIMEALTGTKYISEDAENS